MTNIILLSLLIAHFVSAYDANQVATTDTYTDMLAPAGKINMDNAARCVTEW